MRSHPHALLLPALAALALPSCGSETGETRPRHNVLLITLDTTRPDHMGCYDSSLKTTPNIDAVAADGALFRRVISTAGITPMSHASILTGLNNYRHGMRVFHSEECSHTLKEEVDTLPEILRRVGYRTAALVSAYVVSEIYSLDQGFDHFVTGVDTDALDTSQQQQHATEFDSGGKTNTQRRGDFTVDDALAWLDSDGTSDDPWCMWVHMFDVHDYSLVPPDEFMAKFDITYPDKGTKLRGMKSHEWRARIYDPELEWMDLQVGRLIDWLKANGQYDDTIIVITADHGQGLMDGLKNHGWAKHRLLYDWCIQVPLIVRIPGQADHAVVDTQVRTIDILPTILEALDVGATQEPEGRSLLPLLAGESDGEPRLAYADALNLYDAHSPKKNNLPEGQYDNLYAVSDGRWKLIWHESEPQASQLFDLRQDPLELTNLWRDDHPELARLVGFLEDNEATRVEPPAAGSAASDAEALKGLGYDGDEESESDSEEPPR